jgi:amino acid transporter
VLRHHVGLDRVARLRRERGEGFTDIETPSTTTVVVIALLFMLTVALINFRGVGESVKANVVLTMVELSGLLLVIMVGVWAIFGGNADWGAVVAFDTPDDKNVFLAVTAATSLAFFAMVGFEDSVNMAEETKDPSRIFPRIMLTGLTITGLIYVLVSISAVALVPVGELADSDTPLLEVVRAGAPDLPMDQIFPFISMFAVANSALINMLMASRLLYGMAHQGVLPPFLGKVHPTRRTPWTAIIFTTVIAFGLITYVSSAGDDAIAVLGGTTALLLLGVFTIVNVACLVLRKDTVAHDHFHAPSMLPVLGALTCAYLVGPWTGRDTAQYRVAGLLLVLGVVLWVVTWFANRALRSRPTRFGDPAHLNG